MWRHFGVKDLLKKLTFCSSYMATCCHVSKLKEGRNREYKVCLNQGTILYLIDEFPSFFTGAWPAGKGQSERLIFKTDLIFY
jgi:hypothetical protein